jgi:DHA2 family multidrug resistance protein-like MFS transporter
MEEELRDPAGQGGAAGARPERGEATRAALLGAAREAFTQALQLTAAISAAIVLGIAILAVALLRHMRTGSEPEGHPAPEPAEPPAGDRAGERSPPT